MPPGRSIRSRVRKPSALAIILTCAGVAAIALSAALIILAKPHQRAEAAAGPDAASPPAPAASSTGGSHGGYIDDSALDPSRLLPPPPASGSAAASEDARIFQATRSLKGSARWTLARNDDDQTVAGTLKDFSCAAGATLSPSATPATAALFDNLYPDETSELTMAKQAFKRPRPFLSLPGEICVAKSDELNRSPDYPSGHATWGWLMALLLAEIDPDHATDILVRGRAYGESRAICGAHNASSVDAGRTNGAALAAALHASSDFKVDLDLARRELEGAVKSGRAPDPAACAVEKKLIQARYY